MAEFKLLYSVNIFRCPDCEGIHLTLCEDDGTAVAGVVMPPDMAMKMSDDLQRIVEVTGTDEIGEVQGHA